MILIRKGWLIAIVLMFSGCRDQSVVLLDDLSLLKKQFIAEVLEGAVAGGVDGPSIVRICWEDLQKAILPSHPLNAILNDVIRSKCFVSSWDESSRERSFSEYDASIRQTTSKSNL